ncbi:hypothetical protein FACS1894217_15790 [Clostridia bacterium]|nr:hypothetical protein FACS1894217_15790 [Clostridia bacterium]
MADETKTTATENVSPVGSVPPGAVPLSSLPGFKRLVEVPRSYRPPDAEKRVLTEEEKSQMSAEVQSWRDRRAKPDAGLRLISVVTGGGWVLGALAFIFFSLSAPDTVGFSLGNAGTAQLSSKWNFGLLSVSFLTLLTAFAVCLAAILLSLRRHGVNVKAWNKLLLILTGLVVIGIVLFVPTIPRLF